MKSGRWRAAVLAGATAVVAAVLGLGGVATVAATVAVPSSDVVTTGIPEACSTTNGEYAQAPPTPEDCTGSGPAASIELGDRGQVVDTIDTSSVPPVA